MRYKNFVIIFLFLSALFIFALNRGIAQDTGSDSSFYQNALANAAAVYHQAFGSQSTLYNGSKYGEYLFRFNEDIPFFNADKPAQGMVIYDGIKYDSVFMRYDEVADVLVVNRGTDRIQLLSEKVMHFNLFNTDFIRLEKDSINNSLERTGFYNLLYQGKVQLLKKQVKTIREVIVSNIELQHLVDTKDLYYIKKESEIYPVRSTRDLLTIFADRKKDVQQFIKENRLNFRRDRQNMLTRATSYYDTLKK